MHVAVLRVAMAITGTGSLPGGSGAGGGSPNKVQKRGKEAARERRRRSKVAVARRNKIAGVGRAIHDAGEPHPPQPPPPAPPITSSASRNPRDVTRTLVTPC